MSVDGVRARGLLWLVSLLLVLVGGGAVWAQEAELPPVNLDTTQARLALRLKGELMAPCCWHGTVDLHNSPMATEVSRKIDKLVVEGKSRDEILESMVAQYGERILAHPRGSGLGLWFYLVPILVALVSGVLVSRWLKRQVRKTPAGSPAVATAPAPAAGAWNERFEKELKSLDG